MSTSTPSPEERTARRDAIAATLAGGFPLLRFPADIEPAFRRIHAMRAHGVIRRMLPWVTLLYVAAAVVIFGGSSDAVFHAWTLNALLPVSVAIGWLWIAQFTGLLARNAHLHTMIALLVSMVASVRTIFLVGDSAGVIYITYQVIYLLFIAYTVAQLRLLQAVIATLAAAAVLLLDVQLESLHADWLAFGQYFAATALISGVIGYLMEHRERQDWLRSELAALEKAEMEELRRVADEEARQQRHLGDYLEQVSGNLTPTEIAGRSLAFLVERTGAQVGTVYVSHERRLRRASGYGLEGESRSPDDLDRGESLIGQVAEDGRRLRLRHLPADYRPIRTATGSSAPAELLIEPVMQQGEALAVVELGSLTPFDDRAVALVDRVSRAMATALVAANARDVLARAGISEFMI